MQFLFARRKKTTKRAPQIKPLLVEVDGQSVTLRLKHHQRARRMTLKFNPSTVDFSLTMPRNVNEDEAHNFARSQTDWIKKQLKKAHKPISFAPGSIVPVRGIDHFIRHAGPGRGTVWREDQHEGLPVLWVAGKTPHISRRLIDWLKKEALHDLTQSVGFHAGNMGLEYTKVSVRDQKSRWGSCSSSGTLSFSWRLIMTPEFVLDYVAAHEVAHLAHMNHGPDFWALVERAIPEMERAKTWLRSNGSALHRYGA